MRVCACVRVCSHTCTCECLQGLVTYPAHSLGRLPGPHLSQPRGGWRIKEPRSFPIPNPGASRYNAHRRFLPSVPSDGNRVGDKWALTEPACTTATADRAKQPHSEQAVCVPSWPRALAPWQPSYGEREGRATISKPELLFSMD